MLYTSGNEYCKRYTLLKYTILNLVIILKFILDEMEIIFNKVCYLYGKYSKMLSTSHLIRKEIISLCLKKFLNIYGTYK